MYDGEAEFAHCLVYLLEIVRYLRRREDMISVLSVREVIVREIGTTSISFERAAIIADLP